MPYFIKIPQYESFPTTSIAWTSKPAVGSTNQLIKVSDIGTAGTYFIWKDSRWEPVTSDVTLAVSSTPSSITGTTVETALATITIPGGLMSANGTIEVMSLWSYTNSANAKNLRLRWGSMSGSTVFAVGATTSASCFNYCIARNNNSTSSQKLFAAGALGFGTSATISTPSIDTSANFSIYLTGQVASAAETVTLESYHVFYRE